MMLRPFLLSAPVLLATSVWTFAHAIPVIVNGNFETTSLAASAQMNTTNVTGWSTTGYNFLFFPGTATTTGAASVSYGQFYLSGALASGASNNFPATSPTGGNFLAADGDFQVSAITQTVSNLLPNTQYSVSFLWGAGQQKGSYTSATTEQWKVSLGSEEHDTTIINNPGKGFTGWFTQSFTYTATAASEVLSFLAAGTPSGAPPFALLDGVSIIPIAEPASWMTLVVAVASVLGVFTFQRRSSRLARRAAVNGETAPAATTSRSKLRRRHRRSYAQGAAC